MKTVDEVNSIIPDVVARCCFVLLRHGLIPYKPDDMPMSRFHFILAACEGTVDLAGYVKLFKDCEGKTEEEIIKIAYAATCPNAPDKGEV